MLNGVKAFTTVKKEIRNYASTPFSMTSIPPFFKHLT